MKYNDNGTYKDIYVKAFDTLPIGAIVEYSGATIPSGWTDIGNGKIQKTSQMVTTDYQVNGIYTTSQSQAYSCNYINTLFSSIGDEYSTTEQAVGTWTDGRTVYRKVITSIIDINTANYNCADIYFDNNDIDFIFGWQGYVYNNATLYYPIPNRSEVDCLFFGGTASQYRIRLYAYDKTNIPTGSVFSLIIDYVKKASS